MTKKEYIALFEKYLRNKISEQEQEMFLSMLRDDEQVDSFFYNELKKANSELDEDTANRIFASIRSKISKEKKTTPIITLWRKIAYRAAIFALCLLSAFGAYYLASNTLLNNTVVIATANGERTDIVLPDGSRVWINSGSLLTYNSRRFNRGERRVQLIGEAYFEVARNEQRAFVVETSGVTIQVLGTKFNVRSYLEDNQVSVVLLEGKVKISTATQDAVLTENQQVVFCKSTCQFTINDVYASDFMAWKRGYLFFDNQSLEEIAHTLTRVFDVEIRFASKELKPIRFSGTLCGSNIRNVLDILSLTSPMRYEKRDGVVELALR